jgi:protocatechuate 3,4-dioxygenase beta subunit
MISIQYSFCAINSIKPRDGISSSLALFWTVRTAISRAICNSNQRVNKPDMHTDTLINRRRRYTPTNRRPYFVDDMPNRSDIRSDPSDGSVQQGIPLRLVLHVYDVDNGSCIPLSGAQVDVWHANSQGVYSAVQDAGTGE